MVLFFLIAINIFSIRGQMLVQHHQMCEREIRAIMPMFFVPLWTLVFYLTIISRRVGLAPEEFINIRQKPVKWLLFQGATWPAFMFSLCFSIINRINSTFWDVTLMERKTAFPALLKLSLRYNIMIRKHILCNMSKSSFFRIILCAFYWHN